MDNIKFQNEINQIAWKACDSFRGTVDPAEYKNYILVMLFVKYTSDVWKDHKATYEKKFGIGNARVTRELSREKFILSEDTTFDYFYENRNEKNIGELIDKALFKIEEENKSKLDGVFRGIKFNSEVALGETRERNARIKNLLEDFNDPKMDLRPSVIGDSDIIGNTYQYLIKRFASDSGKKGGEFYTPHEVSKLLASLVGAKSGDTICDPACGSGSLLIEVAKTVGDNNYSLYGQESNGSTWAIGKMNMYLHGISNSKIERGDTLNHPRLLRDSKLMTFDVVVANPPFSLDKWADSDMTNDQYGRFHRGVPPKSKGDYAFLLHMIETANPIDGTVGVIVPHGVLFRGSAEGKIRKKLIEENMLEAVIGLPEKLFYGTSIPAAILIFKKNRKRKDVLFIDASSEFQKDKNQNSLRTEDIEKIVKTYKNWKTVDKYAYVATLDEIAENGYNLNIPRYVDTFEEEEPVDIAATQKEIEKIETELANIKKKMNKYLSELGVD